MLLFQSFHQSTNKQPNKATSINQKDVSETLAKIFQNPGSEYASKIAAILVTEAAGKLEQDQLSVEDSPALRTKLDTAPPGSTSMEEMGDTDEEFEGQ